MTSTEQKLREALEKIQIATDVPQHKRDDTEFLRACASIAQAFANAALAAPSAGETAEHDMLKLIDERDDAEQALSHAYFLVTGRSPEWSNLFGHQDALGEIEDALIVLRKSIPRATPTEPAETGGQTLKLPREIALRLSSREDGGLRICSDDVPGLIMSGRDIPAMLRDLPLALADLIAHNGITTTLPEAPREVELAAIGRNRGWLIGKLNKIANTGQGVEPDHWAFRCMARTVAREILDRISSSPQRPKMTEAEAWELLAREYERATLNKSAEFIRLAGYHGAVATNLAVAAILRAANGEEHG